MPDRDENERTEAVEKLLLELAKGEQSGREEGWLTIEDIEALLENSPFANSL